MFNDVYYKPIEVKTFKGNYVKYESNGDKDCSLSIIFYFSKVEPFLCDLIDFYKIIGEWKIQLSMQVNFTTDNNDDKGLILHTKSDNVEIMWGIDTKTIVTKLFDTLKQRYQEGLETKMDASNYIFDRVVLLEYHFHKVSLKRGSSYIPSPKWLINKKSTLDPHNKDNWCFLFGIVLALNYQRISNNPQRVSNLMPFIPNYNWVNIEFPAGHKEYTIFERDNCDIALNILYVPHKTQEIRPAYISKHKKTCNIHANLLMITDGYGNWHYLAIKSIPVLLRGLTSTHNGDYYCLNCFHSYRTQARLEKHERLCCNNDHSAIIMPNEKNKYISTTSVKNSMRAPLVIHADI